MRRPSRGSICKGNSETHARFVDYAMGRVRMLVNCGVTPYIVFDGGPLPAKKGTEVSRAKYAAPLLYTRASSDAD